MSVRLLIRGGDVIDTEPNPVLHKETDVLIEDGRILGVGQRLPAEGAEIIDATGRIVLPGFIDTHRHLWQAGLRSLVLNDDNLGAYLELVLQQIAPRFRPEDLHIGNRAGAVECLAAGITTVQDFSVVYSVEHGEAAIDGLRAAGIRAVYGAGYPVFGESARQPENLRKLRGQHTDGLVTMALAAVGPSFMPIEVAEEDWRLADELGLPVVTHVASGPVAERPVAALRERGLLRANTLYIHGNSLPDDELRLIAESGAALSVTPTVEAHLNIGPPMPARAAALGVTAGLGIDVVTTSGGDMFSQMRAALLTSQVDDGYPALSPADVLRMATVDGAKALGLADRVGSLRPGKDADLILLRANDPNLVAAHDLIGAVVTAAHPGNIDRVLVAGREVGTSLSDGQASELRRSAEFVTTHRPDPDR